MSLILHSLAGPATVAGAIGATYTALYTIALRHADLGLIPASAMPRVLWWGRHRSIVFLVSSAFVVLGLVTYAST